ncbi:MAG: hypothetical protein RLY31_3259 [Bacteroidota bacterium]
MHTSEYQARIRYADTDRMGYLYYGRYAELYEVGRTEMLRNLGMRYLEMEEQHQVMLPVASLQMRFIRPATYDELLLIRTTLLEWPDKFLSFQTEVLNEAGKLVNEGQVRLAFVDSNTRRSIPAPAFFLDLVRPFFPDGPGHPTPDR